MVLSAGCRDTAPSIETSGRHIGVDSSSQHVNLLAMGDWGTGSERQQRVADRLKSYVLESGAKFDGILLAGDNFYVDLSGVDDFLYYPG